LVEKYGHWRFAIPYDIGATIVSRSLKLQRRATHLALLSP